MEKVIDRTLPSRFVESLKATGSPLFDNLAEILVTTAPSVAVRDNRAKGFRYPAEAADGDVPWWADGGHYLAERPRFPMDPAWHQGLYYVQDASSMFIARVISRLTAETGGAPLCYLDACAAPGGKTTAAIDALPAGSLVVANEYVPSRAAILKENIIKWGSPSTIVTRGDTRLLAKALPATFDIVAADVPCSGEGMMRKEPEAVAQWSEGLVAECVARQEEIVDNLWSTLRPGGYFIYSTCTFNLSENERMVARMVDRYGAESVAVDVEPSWMIAPAVEGEASACRFIPGRVRGEGLFMAVLRKPAGESAAVGRRRDKSGKERPVPREAAPAAGWLTDPEAMTFTVDADRVNAFPTRWLPLLKALSKTTDVIYHGVNVATLKGRDLIPSQAMAMATSLRRGAFPEADVDLSTALDYLRRMSVTLPDSVPRGFVLLTYRNRPLGFVKNLGNRANNLYPQSWKISG